MTLTQQSIQSYLKAEFRQIEMQAVDQFARTMAELDLPLSKEMMRSVMDQPDLMAMFLALDKGEPITCEDEYWLCKMTHRMEMLDREIAEYLDASLYENERRIPVEPTDPDRPWHANLIRQKLTLFFSGVQLLRTSVPADPETNSDRQQVIELFDRVLSDYEQVFQQVRLPFTDVPRVFDPEEIAEIAKLDGDHRFYHPPTTEAPEAEDKPHFPFAAIDPDKNPVSAVQTAIQCRLKPGLSLTELDEQLHAIEAILRYEWQESEKYPEAATCLEMLYLMRMMCVTLDCGLVTPVWQPERQIGLFTDMHADLVLRFWSSYAKLTAEQTESRL